MQFQSSGNSGSGQRRKGRSVCGSMPCGCARESRVPTMVESDACLERRVRRVLIPSTKFEC